MKSKPTTPAEGKTRDEIDHKLTAAGWVVRARPKMNLYEGLAQAAREFTPQGRSRSGGLPAFRRSEADRHDRGQTDGTTLTEVELQSMLYTTGLPEQLQPSSKGCRSHSSRPARRPDSPMGSGPRASLPPGLLIPSSGDVKYESRSPPVAVAAAVNIGLFSGSR